MFPMRRPPTGGTNPNTNLPSWEEFLRNLRKQKRKGTQARRQASRSPGGWQGGGMVGRNMFNPRAAGAAAMRRNAPPPQERIRFEGPDWPRPRGTGRGDRPPGGWPVPTPPGGWQGGGAVGYQGGGGVAGDYMPGGQPWTPPEGYDQQAAAAAAAARARAFNRARAAAARTGTQARRQASRSPGGWNIGGAVDSTEDLMAERDRLQQLLQTADEAMAQEIMAQIMEINKELEMEARNFGMAGGGVASLMGDVRGYQGGGAPRRTGALHGSIIGDPSSGRWTEHFPAIGQNPIYSGWGNVSWNPNKWSTVTNFNNQNLPYPNRPPGGG